MAVKRLGVPVLKDARIIQETPVIVRADFDIAAVRGKIQDSSRIKAALPTVRFLLGKRARVRIIAHRGRPKGMGDAQLSLAQIARTLSTLLHRKIVFVDDPFASDAAEKYGNRGDILLFENLRFWPGEEKNDPSFAASLARWGEIYVNEAFANCHRAHASMAALPALLPAYAGLYLTQELTALEQVMKNPKRPLVAVLGGAKMETKIPLIRRFLRDADHVLVGGALANTIFVMMGKNVGKSVVEVDKEIPPAFLKDRKLCLPSDVLAVDKLAAGAACRVRAAGEVRASEYIADIGSTTRKSFAACIAGARTVVWNGPMGFSEVPAFAKGTIAIANAMRTSKGFTVVGGGDTLGVLARYRISKGFGHVSMGGGAMLEFLSGKKLPALEALRR